MMIIGNDRWWLWCDSNDGCDCDGELLCHRIKTQWWWWWCMGY